MTMDFITTKEAAEKWGISPTRITILANEGRISGAQQVGRTWLIPADAARPEKRKGGRKPTPAQESADFSLPLYHFRSDWSSAKEKTLSQQQRSLLRGETAVMECRFEEAYDLLEPILRRSEDVTTEIGALWNAGMCCIALNRPADFSRIYLRLQLLLSEELPYREELSLILAALKTYVVTVSTSAGNASPHTDLHEQCLPMLSVLMGFDQLAKEAIKPGSAAVALLEINLRLLKHTSSLVAAAFLHCHLLNIHSLRQNMEAAQRHARSVVQLAFEAKLYFPLVTYYSYHIPLFSAILQEYPAEFQTLCRDLSTQYEKNYTDFAAAIMEDSLLSKLTEEDYPYAIGVLTGSTNARIAENLGVSPHTVRRRLDKVCKKLGVENKRDLRDFLRGNM